MSLELLGGACHNHRETLQLVDTVEVRNLIVQVAIGRGMFSIWFHFFRDDLDMRRRLIEAFPGTAPDAFDDDHSPVARSTS